MSRLAGLFLRSSRYTLDEIMTRFAAPLRLRPEWNVALLPFEDGGLLWSGSQAPKVATEGNLHVVMDGAVYNRPDFDTSSSDAELILKLWRKSDMGYTLRAVNADLAVAVYDSDERKLWLGRDRFGLKPLYYTSTQDYFAFASQPQPLLQLPGLRAIVRRRYVAVFAGSHYRYFDNDRSVSPYVSISEVPPSTFVTVSARGVTTQRYWSLEEAPNHEGTVEELAAQYRSLLQDAVAVRLKSSRRPGFTLSGGMDSSSVLTMAVAASGCKQTAFSTVYSDKTYDESSDIRSVVDSSVSRWVPLAIDDRDIFGTIQDMVRVHAEPVATATWLSHFRLCRAVGAEGFDALFGGLGGDELNAGEYEYFFFHFADLLAEGKEDRLRHEVKKWIQYHDHPIFKKSEHVMRETLARTVDLARRGRCLPDRARLLKYAKAIDRDFYDLQTFEPVMDQPFTSYLKNRAYQDIFRETAPCCLRAEDRQTTVFDVENYAPFFDHRLVEFMFRVPGDLKIRDGVTKHLLRLAMKGLLPEETRTRIKKTGWNAPAHLWFSGKGCEVVRDLVESDSFRQRGIYNLDEVRRLLREHDEVVASGAPSENHMMFLWQLVNLELWFRTFKLEVEASD